MGMDRQERNAVLAGVLAFIVLAATSVTSRLWLVGRLTPAVVIGLTEEAPAREITSSRDLPVAALTLRLSIDKTGVSMFGRVPSYAKREELIRRAAFHFGPDKVTDQLFVDDNIVATPWFYDVTSWFPPNIKGLLHGEVEVAGTKIFLAGEMSSQQALEAGLRQMRALAGPSGDIINELRVAPSENPKAPVPTERMDDGRQSVSPERQ
jgi:hypothetical protein